MPSVRGDSGDGIDVVVYPPDAADCSGDEDCGGSEACGLAGKCGGVDAEYGFVDGWVLGVQDDIYTVSFEGTLAPEAGSLVQVSYNCLGGCQ